MPGVDDRIGGKNTPWPLSDVLRVLADAAEHLLQVHDCDHDGYEAIDQAMRVARKIAGPKPPKVNGRYQWREGSVNENHMIVEGPDGVLQMWIRGFTYKTWRCAVSGVIISCGRDSRAWRIESPKSGTAASIRVAESAFQESFIIEGRDE